MTDPWRTTAETILRTVCNVVVCPYATRDFGREQFSEAVSVLLPSAEAQAKLPLVTAQLPAGLWAFVGHHTPEEDTELVVVAGDDQFAMVRWMQTDGINYDLETEDIIEKLQDWDVEFGIRIFRVTSDGVAFTLATLPDDMLDFCEQELEPFCPDIVGYYGVEELAEQITRTKTLELWWD